MRSVQTNLDPSLVPVEPDTLEMVSPVMVSSLACHMENTNLKVVPQNANALDLTTAQRNLLQRTLEIDICLVRLID